MYTKENEEHENLQESHQQDKERCDHHKRLKSLELYIYIE